MREASVSRRTAETDVAVSIALDGTGKAEIATGVGFLDHMLELFARHGLFDVTAKVTGDLHVDQHHTTEDTGIALGQAFAQALGDKKGIARYADIHMPMDETLTRVVARHFGPPVPRLQHHLPDREDRRVRHRAGAGILSGLRHPGGRHAACGDALRREFAPHRRELLQGPGAGAAPGRRGGPEGGRTRSFHQGHAVALFCRQSRISGAKPIRLLML